MKKMALIQAAGFLLIFILIVFCFAGVGSGGAGSVASPLVGFATEKEAYRALNLIRQNEAYKSAWVLKR